MINGKLNRHIHRVKKHDTNYVYLLHLSKLKKEEFCTSFITFREVKNSQNLSDKLSGMTSSGAFRENLIFANEYFKWYNLIIFSHI